MKTTLLPGITQSGLIVGGTMSKYLVIDLETESHNKGHVHDPKNYIVAIGMLFDGEYIQTYSPNVAKEYLEKCDVVVGFNLKFDLSWIKRETGYIPAEKKIWDCQIAEYILKSQIEKYPSLNGSLSSRGMEEKDDFCKPFWDAGKLTSEIPMEGLLKYLEQDVKVTYDLFKSQIKECNEKQKTLVKISSADMLTLLDMESNGLLYDMEKIEDLSLELEGELANTDKDLSDLSGYDLNWSSPKQVAAYLYGGTVLQEKEEVYMFEYRDKKKPPKLKTRKVKTEIGLPGLVAPFSTKSEKGSHSVSSGELEKIKCTSSKVKKFLELYKKRTKTTKTLSTYCVGIKKLVEKYGWKDSLVHGSLIQCSTSTGRLSSSAPNLQNIPPEVKKMIVTRFKENLS